MLERFTQNNRTLSQINAMEHSWNVNDLVNHRRQLLAFINNNKFDINLLSTIHFAHINYLKTQGFNDYDIKHPYITIHCSTVIIIHQQLILNRPITVAASIGNFGG